MKLQEYELRLLGKNSSYGKEGEEEILDCELTSDKLYLHYSKNLGGTIIKLYIDSLVEVKIHVEYDSTSVLLGGIKEQNLSNNHNHKMAIDFINAFSKVQEIVDDIFNIDTFKKFEKEILTLARNLSDDSKLKIV